MEKSIESIQDSGPPLILASQSPQRRRLLAEAGYAFRIVEPDPQAECGVCSRETPPELVARLAWQKAASVAPQVSRGIVIGCDTVAECQGQILGKPVNREHAAEMLTLLRGRRHRVYSGLCLWHRPGNWHYLEVDVSELQMHAIDLEELNAYLDSGAWEGKAGACGYQDRLGWMELLSGSESNVIGLPLELLTRMLARIDRDDPRQDPTVV